MSNQETVQLEVYDLLQQVDKLQRIASNVKDKVEALDSTIIQPGTKNNVLGYDNSFCLEGEIMFVVDTGELVIVGKQYSDTEVGTYTMYNSYIGPKEGKTLTHHIRHCVNKFAEDIRVYEQERYIVKKCDNDTEETSDCTVITSRDVIKRVNSILNNAIAATDMGENCYNTKKYNQYRNNDIEHVMCPVCGGHVSFNHYRSDDYYFECYDCESTHWFNFFPDIGVDVPKETRMWEEEVAIKKKEE